MASKFAPLKGVHLPQLKLSMADISLRVTAPAGDLTGKLNTVVLSGFITQASAGMPASAMNCVSGSCYRPVQCGYNTRYDERECQRQNQQAAIQYPKV